MVIIGITGTIGAGKGTVVEYLVEKYRFKHYSVRSYLTAILKENNLDPNRDNLTKLANRLREENKSSSFIIEALYEKARKNKENAIIESIRTVGEIIKLKSKGEFYLLSVDADQRLRYQRVQSRKSATDFLSYEKFLEDEEREMSSDNENHQNLRACIQHADYKITNDKGIQHLRLKIDEVINNINL